MNSTQEEQILRLAVEIAKILPPETNRETEDDPPRANSSATEGVQFSPSKDKKLCVECVNVPTSDIVAEIVGKRGSKIQTLRRSTNTKIRTPARGEEPVFIISGTKKCVQEAKKSLLSAVEHFSALRMQRKKITDALLCESGTKFGAGDGADGVCMSGVVTVKIQVPEHVVGLVVGPKGATIKRIQNFSHTIIKTPTKNEGPFFAIHGSLEAVEAAKNQIQAHITSRAGIGDCVNIIVDRVGVGAGTGGSADVAAAEGGKFYSNFSGGEHLTVVADAHHAAAYGSDLANFDMHFHSVWGNASSSTDGGTSSPRSDNDFDFCSREKKSNPLSYPQNAVNLEESSWKSTSDENINVSRLGRCNNAANRREGGGTSKITAGHFSAEFHPLDYFHEKLKLNWKIDNCFGCGNANASYFLVSCGHDIFCNDCACKLIGKKCPICGADVIAIVKDDLLEGIV